LRSANGPRPVVAVGVAGSPSPARSLFGFFALTYAVSWAFFIAAVAWSRDLPAGSSLPAGIHGLVLMGAIAPSLVALTLTARAEGPAGMREMFGRVFAWRVNARWYAFAIGYMAAIELGAALAHRLITGTWPRFGDGAWYVMAGAMVVSTWVQAGEEIGWRGHALPRLASRLGLGGASIVLGVMWAFWHLPLFYLQGAEAYGQSFMVYLLQVTAISIAMAWLYWKTGGSLLLVMLMHAAINNTRGIVPAVLRTAANPFLPSASLMSWLGAIVLWIAAVYFLVRMRHAELAGRSPNRMAE